MRRKLERQRLQSVFGCLLMQRNAWTDFYIFASSFSQYQVLYIM